MRKWLFIILFLVLMTVAGKTESALSEKEKTKNTIISSACLVTANRLLTYTYELTTPVEGDRILDQQMDAKTGKYLRVKLQKTNGFLCDYSFTPPPLRIKCSRGEEQFTKKGDLSGRNAGAIILSTSQDEDGGILPFAVLQYSENGIAYLKNGSIIKASLQDYYFTVDCNTLKILDSRVLPQKQIMDIITSDNFKSKVKLIPMDGVWEGNAAYTDVGDILKMLLRSKQ